MLTFSTRWHLLGCEYPGEWLWATPRTGLTLLLGEPQRCLASDTSAGHTLVSPNGHPGAGAERDLIGACTGDVTPHSIVRSPRRVGSERDIERGSTDVMMMTDAERAATEVVLGVDTHLDVHVAVALDRLGRRLGELSVPTTAKGYERLVRWAEGFGTVRGAGVERTSSYGAAITRYLRTAATIPVTEVERPKRRHLHRSSKSDSRDAESAARAGNEPERQPGSPRVQTAAWR
jgi:hypothetical protein